MFTNEWKERIPPDHFDSFARLDSEGREGRKNKQRYSVSKKRERGTLVLFNPAARN